MDKLEETQEGFHVTLFDDDFISFDEIESENSVLIRNADKIRYLIKNNQIPFDGRLDLKVEAFVLRQAYTNNKLLSLSNSRTRILAHQVESTHRIINSLNQRFLIADEVGLGKTIEAGLVIKELIFRFEYDKILIICPASLVLQWQNELESKFNESFEIIDRKFTRKYHKNNTNPWNAFRRGICSIDFIKSDSNRDDLLNAKWDVVVIDEAHRLRRDDLKTTLAYNVAELLSGRSRSFLLLTATPFRGKLEELYFLIRLIDKNLLGPFQTFYNTFCLNDSNLSRLREKISSIIIRRTKKEIGGFTKRHAKTIRFEFFPEERVLYDATTRYVVEEYNKAMQTENRAVGFVMTVFQKLLDSSTVALLSALTKRRNHLSYLIDRSNEAVFRNKLIEKKLSEFADIDESEDMDDLIEETVKKTRAEIKEEILILDNLISIAESVTRNKKAEKLIEIIQKLIHGKCKKILIFTQFRTTQDFLKVLLHEFKVEIFNGSMDKDQKEVAIINFKEKADILICTEAGGEGRNMQFCNVLINYDLPWSPVKIEQRIGRIHRFGQPYDVYIYNFSTKDTVAERILNVLIKKLKLFEESIGTPDVLLGQIEEELNLNSIFMRMALSGNSRKVYSEIDEKLENARKSYEKLNDLAIAKKMDFNYNEYYEVTLEERKYSNKRIENFVNRLRDKTDLVDKYLSTKHKITRLYTLKELPDGRRVSKKGTFNSTKALDNESLEFLAFGNPIVDVLVEKCHNEDFGGNSGIKVIKHEKELSGMIFYYVINFKTLNKHREFIPVFIPSKNSVKDEECGIIETKSLEMYPDIKFKINNYNTEIQKIQKNADKYFDSASVKIIEKAEEVIGNFGNDIDSSISDEKEKIKDSYSKKIKEYEEQLERQVCQMKWFKKDMKSAITRTKNNIVKEYSEMERLLSGYSRLMNIDYSVELVCAGIIFSVK
ncbi:MAG: DEAD/DEAH box helicase family protein [Spirochaetes bacterium]|nr:DEAD/DEAH box helicase family protein [Spirochaetota bacterium]